MSIIISGGSNIYPREVEEVLLLHPDVAEVSVVGRTHADWGEEVVAFIVTRGGQTLSPAELDKLCDSLIKARSSFHETVDNPDFIMTSLGKEVFAISEIRVVLPLIVGRI